MKTRGRGGHKGTRGGLRKSNSDYINKAALTPQAIDRLAPFWATPDPGAQRELDELLLLPNGQCKVVPTAELLRFPFHQLAAWGNINNLFQFPTQELVDWLGEHITEPALEICAGMSILGSALGIHQTDSGAHAEGTAPEPLVERYRLMQRVRRYIVTGNLHTHGAKWILKNKPHSTLDRPWLITRSQFPEQNRLWVWPPLPANSL